MTRPACVTRQAVAPTIDFFKAQPYADWEVARGSECPVITSEGGMSMGAGTTFQVTRYKDAEQVLRDGETFSSTINAEHIGQFMGDLILAMDGAEHRKYRNLVAKAFRASQLEQWDETLVRPMINRAARRHRAARARRPRRERHVEVPGAGDLRHRGRAARGRARSSRVGRADQHRADAPGRRTRGVGGDGRVPAPARRSAAREPDGRLPLAISCTPRSTASS